MTFKSATQPFCRWCGKPIRKRTERIAVYQEAPQSTYVDRHTGHETRVHVPKHVIAEPASIDDCRKLTNLQVVSVDRGGKYSDKKRIRAFNVWDGETYEDGFFDTGECAKNMGYAAAVHHGLTTAKYREAVAKQKESA